MASTYSALKIELIGTGDQTGTWGTTTNVNLGTALEEAIVGRGTANFSTDGNLTLTLTDTNATQVARNLVLNCTSGVSLSATRDLIVPAIEKPYIIQNNTTGGQSIRVIVAGASVTVPNGRTAYIYNDGTDIKYAFDQTGNLNVNGTLDATGALTTSSTASFGGNTAITGTLSATGDGTFSGTGQIKVPAGTSGQRSGSPAAGMLRFNTTTGGFEGFDGANWGAIGGGGGGQAGGAILVNKTNASVSYTIPSGENGLSVGPVTIDTGITITVSSGQRWLVL
jgi:hypothetical protein